MSTMTDLNLGAGDCRLPSKAEVALQSAMLESLITESYNSSLIFPANSARKNSVAAEIKEVGGNSIAITSRSASHSWLDL